MLLCYNILSEQKYEFFCSFAIVEVIYFILCFKTNHPACSGFEPATRQDGHYLFCSLKFWDLQAKDSMSV